MPLPGVGNQSRLFEALFAQDAARRQDRDTERQQLFQALGLGSNVLGTSLDFLDSALTRQQTAEQGQLERDAQLDRLLRGLADKGRERQFLAGESALDRSAEATQGDLQRQAALARLRLEEGGRTTRAQEEAQLRRDLAAEDAQLRRDLSADDLALGFDQIAAADARAGLERELQRDLAESARRAEVDQFQRELDSTLLDERSARSALAAELLGQVDPVSADMVLEQVLRLINPPPPPPPPTPFVGPTREQARPIPSQAERAAARRRRARLLERLREGIF